MDSINTQSDEQQNTNFNAFPEANQLKNLPPFDQMESDVFNNLVTRSGALGVSTYYGVDREKRISSLKWKKRFNVAAWALVITNMMLALSAPTAIALARQGWNLPSPTTIAISASAAAAVGMCGLFGVVSASDQEHQFTTYGIPNDVEQVDIATLASRRCDLRKLAKQGLVAKNRIQAARVCRFYQRQQTRELRQQLQTWSQGWEAAITEAAPVTPDELD